MTFRFNSIVFLSFLLCCALCAQIRPVISENLDELSLRVRSSSLEDTKAIAQAATLFAREIDRCLGFDGVPRQTLQLTILRPGEDAAKDEESDLCFAYGSDSLLISYKLCQALLKRRIEEKFGLPLGAASSAHWMAAAVCRRVFFAGKGLLSYYRPDYGVAQRQFRQGRFPKLETLLCHSPEPGSSAIFRLYMLHCDLFLARLESLPESAVFMQRLLELELHGRSPCEALEFLLGDGLSSGDNLQSWYEKGVQAESTRGLRYSELDSILAELEDLFNPAILQPGEKQSIKKVPMRDMARQLEDYKLNTQAISLMQNKISRLAKQAPFLLQEPLHKFNKALLALQKNKKRHFRKEFQQAEKEFQKALERQNRIAGLLEENAARENPPLLPFASFLKAVDQASKTKP